MLFEQRFKFLRLIIPDRKSILSILLEDKLTVSRSRNREIPCREFRWSEDTIRRIFREENLGSFRRVISEIFDTVQSYMFFSVYDIFLEFFFRLKSIWARIWFCEKFGFWEKFGEKYLVIIWLGVEIMR